ncbi:APC family permease [Parasphingorhabdus halotolerans]|uniref:Amino acid permease n=1 Tax=Parasphingorhabdus halotolerans TaxID=2725558 RepID=A0A6H2DM42_9SPHN|nr:APC family permease [Parasphingorhabdus halotolerans]QJB69258.1 amino acid permease [Parasphingorhabdus halotolerans]
MKDKLPRILGFWDMFFIAVGQVIGAGAVALTGVAIGMTRPGVFWAYICASLLALMTNTLAMVAGSALPVVGAYYVWPSRLCGGWIGSVALFLVLMVAVVSISLFGSAFGLYLRPIFPVFSQNGWGIIMIILIFLTNYFGLRMASIVQTLLVLVMLSAFAVYIGFAVPEMQAQDLAPILPNGISGFLTAVFVLKFATTGASTIVSLGGDMKNPGRDIPLVMICATLTVGLIYAFFAFASIAVLPWIEMVDQPLTVAGKAFLPSWALSFFLIGGAGVALATTLNASIMQVPRNFMVAAWDQLIPEKLGTLSKNGVPYQMLNLVLILGLIPLIAGLDIGAIARAVGIITTLPTIIILWSITRIPLRFPDVYARAIFKLSPFWIWAFFLSSTLSVLIGLVILAQGLTVLVLVTIIFWVCVSVAYYPIRRVYLRGKGVDLDHKITDLSIFGEKALS